MSWRKNFFRLLIYDYYLIATTIHRVYSSEEQISLGYYINIANVYPLHHSILILVDTTTPLATNSVWGSEVTLAVYRYVKWAIKSFQKIWASLGFHWKNWVFLWNNKEVQISWKISKAQYVVMHKFDFTLCKMYWDFIINIHVSLSLLWIRWLWLTFGIFVPNSTTDFTF